jgi:hypothetical protein
MFAHDKLGKPMLTPATRTVWRVKSHRNLTTNSSVKAESFTLLAPHARLTLYSGPFHVSKQGARCVRVCMADETDNRTVGCITSETNRLAPSRLQALGFFAFGKPPHRRESTDRRRCVDVRREEIVRLVRYVPSTTQTCSAIGSRVS